ncbi:DUF2087 domain-containing protein [Microbacterium dauci]|uniref:DUF2087 domain-containing protein n=1 Tax=Microbacterium dauci TaxID=3048008 RepID=A0ABT6ZF38_9MICO|nr:DUF2087 domain-containing protein [Microbacterium sp. LX3-4]MDJ1114775.1 DUF2087 domain-containing protein [Microbacterium sp. LX3-4]
MGNAQRWKPLIAVFANPETRRAAAMLLLGETLEQSTAHLSPSKRSRVLGALRTSGLVTGDDVDPEVFRRVLEATATPRREGIDRFLEGKRIAQYPADLTTRAGLLAWVARDALAPDEVLTEPEINERLLPYAEDVAVLRRYLVDHELVERTPDGAEYALVAPGDSSTGMDAAWPRL